MGIYFLSEKSTVKTMYSHTKSFLIIRSYTNFYLKTLKEGFHLSFGGSQTVINSAGSTICLTKKVNWKCIARNYNRSASYSPSKITGILPRENTKWRKSCYL